MLTPGTLLRNGECALHESVNHPQCRQPTLPPDPDPKLPIWTDRMHPVSLSALPVTLVLLFAFQGSQILAKPVVILLPAIPILIQGYFNSGLVCLLKGTFRV